MIGQPALGGDAGLSAIFVARHKCESDEGSQCRGSCDDVDGVHVFIVVLWLCWTRFAADQRTRSKKPQVMSAGL